MFDVLHVCCKPRYGQDVELQLGGHTIDVTSRALVMGELAPLDAGPEIGVLADQRPALISVHDEAQLATVQAVFDGPVVIRSSNAALVDRCLRSGAVMAHDLGGFGDPEYLRVVEEAGGGVIISCAVTVADYISFLTERTHWAEAAGISTSSIVVDATGSTDDERTSLAVLGHPLMITTADEPEAAGLQVVHMMDGVRVFATHDVRTARRTLDTVAELLERRLVHR